MKFTENGGIGVVVEPGDYENEIRIEVRDTGIGISEDDLWRIFHDFEQADGSSTRKYGGTGLGLAISKRIIERMNGCIDVTSQVGVGSTFSISVQLLPADTQEPTVVASRTQSLGRHDRCGGGNRGIIARAPARAMGRQHLRRDR